jgi:hypothetical protein
MSVRWSPPLPTIGRAGPRIVVQLSWTLQQRLEHYFLEVESSPDMFVRKVPHAVRRRVGIPIDNREFLEDFPPEYQYRILMRTLWNASIYSKAYRAHLWRELQRPGGLNKIRQWYYTANGIVIPYILCCKGEIDYEVVDRLTKFTLSNCANNYAQFTSRVKLWKKLVRKHFANRVHELPRFRDIAPLGKVYLPLIEAELGTVEKLQSLFICTQTRASGLADGKMLRTAEERFLNTIEEPYAEIKLQSEPLHLATMGSTQTQGRYAKVSCGPSGTLEKPRAQGGQTGYLKDLCKERVLFRSYNFENLESRRLYKVGKCIPLEELDFSSFYSLKPEEAIHFLDKQDQFTEFSELYHSRKSGMKVRYQTRKGGVIHTKQLSYVDNTMRDYGGKPIRSAEELLSWAVQTALFEPIRVRCVRTHTVSEPSKARVITVPSYAYTVIMYVFSHLWQRTLKGQHVRSGLQSSRHLWNLLWRDLHPQNNLWERLKTGEPVYGLSTDWSEATDHGNPTIARQIWHSLIMKSAQLPGFPLGLAVLAKSLYCGRRYVYSRLRARPVIKSRAWFMGDPMTKVILTIINDYVHHIARPAISSGVGDDTVALDNSKELLENYLQEMEAVEMKISWEDTYISTLFIYYCEEASMIPRKPSQAPVVRVRRGKDSIPYIDYPRIRLLLPVKPELDRWSYTTLGKFSLLGKETRWSIQTNPRLSEKMIISGLLQHLLLARERETISPYIPEEIGGDGSYHPNPEFVTQVILRRSWRPREVLTRMSQLTENAFGFKFIRSERTNQVTHKYHHWLPKYRDLLTLIPESAIIRPKSDEHRALIGSLRTSEIETPEQTLMRLMKNYFYKAILRGEEPKLLSLSRDQIYGSGHPPLTWVLDPLKWVKYFLRFWRNPGFRFRNQFEFFVNRSQVEEIDYLSLGWVFNPEWRASKLTLHELWNTYIQRSMDLISNDEDLLRLVKGEHPTIPDRIRSRLNLFMESDNLILLEFMQLKEVPDHVILVSADRKLAGHLQRLGVVRNPRLLVWLVLPIVYLLGRTEECTGSNSRRYKASLDMSSALTIEDPGAMMHADFIYFQDGMIDEQYFTNQVLCYPTRLYPGVFTVFIGGELEPADDADWAEEFKELLAKVEPSERALPPIGGDVVIDH